MAYIVHFLSDWADQDPNCLPITRRFICMLDYVMRKPVFVSLAVDLLQPSGQVLWILFVRMAPHTTEST